MIGTLRRELLDRLLILNERHPRQVLTEYLQLPDGPRSAHDCSQVPDQGCAGQFTGSFDAVFQADGIRILTSPPQTRERTPSAKG